MLRPDQADTPLKVRALLPDAMRRRSYAKGAAIFLAATLLWIGLFAGGLVVSSLLAKVTVGIILGLATGVLFVIGHDAAHNSLTPSTPLNRWLAKLAFLPSLHPVCTWETGHNKLHHGWTGVKGKDAGYAPLSPQEFLRLPSRQQRLHQFFHTPSGSGFYYLIDIWWKRQVCCRAPGFGDFTRRTGWFDYGAVALFSIAQVALISTTSAPDSFAQNVTALFLVPFLAWNYVMAFVTIQHHTHPQVPWHADLDDWSFYKNQVRGTVHIVPPKMLDLAFAHIFHHTAHHVDKTIPLYHLHQAQAELEKRCGGDVHTVQMSYKHFHHILSVCQAFDYETGAWMTFKEVSRRGA